jgi:hypothetical protein
MIIDHGKWLPYTPDPYPQGAPPNALFARRESDSLDWYEHVKTGFQDDSVKFMATWRSEVRGYVIGPATYDASAIWPPNQVVGEITDYTGSDPQADFGGKVYDPVALTIGAPVYINPALDDKPGKTTAQILGVT